MSCLFVIVPGSNHRCRVSQPVGKWAEKGVGSRAPLGYLAPAIHRQPVMRRGGRVVDRAALEMRSTGDRTGGSNPSLSAILPVQTPKQPR